MVSDSDCDDVDIEYSESDTCSLTQSSDSDEDVYFDKSNCSDDWKVINNETNTPPPLPRFDFTGNSVLNNDILSFSRPYEFFNFFFDDQLIQNIVNETNLFYQQSQQTTPSSSSNVQTQWFTSTSEMRIFIVIIMTMSLVRKPDEKLYWSKNSSISTPFFAKIMSHRKFTQIKKYLHFSNNQNYDPATHPQPKLNKIWPVYCYLNSKFQDAYTPQQDIIIDESLMLYKGKLGWMQYMPKDDKYGIKTFLLCESKSGYIWSSVIYTDKGTIFDHSNYKNLPIPSQIVMTLIKPLLNRGYCLTIDSFFSSVELAELLVNNSTDIFGIIKSNSKGFPESLKTPKNAPAGHTAAYRKGKVMILRWKENRDIYLVSTVHGSNTGKIMKNNKSISKPQVLIDYNQVTGDIDRVDQQLSKYPVNRKRGEKYYKKMFFHFIEQALWNSFVLFTKTDESMTYLEYRQKIIDDYVEKYHRPEFSSKGERPGRTPNPLRLTERHFLELIPMTYKKVAPTKRCYVCCLKKDVNGKRIRRESRYHCPDCNVSLCLTPCFKIYHTKLNF